MKIISTRVHGVMDYIMGIALIASPWLFDFYRGGPESWIPMAVGITTIIYSLFTNYEFGAIHMMRMSVHLTLDVCLGIILFLSPWIAGFSEIVSIPHSVFGFMIVCAGAITDTRPIRFRPQTHVFK